MGKALLIIFTVLFFAVHLGAVLSYLIGRPNREPPKDDSGWDGRGGY